MAKKKETEVVEYADTGTHEVEPIESAQRPELAEMVPAELATVPPPPNGAATVRRRAKRGRTDRTYWVCGRRSPGSPVQHLMPEETIGRARKLMAKAKLMPAYDGWELWTTRETKVS